LRCLLSKNIHQHKILHCFLLFLQSHVEYFLSIVCKSHKVCSRDETRGKTLNIQVSLSIKMFYIFRTRKVMGLSLFIKSIVGFVLYDMVIAFCIISMHPILVWKDENVLK